MNEYQIHRTGSILIKDKRLLVARDKDEDYFKSPGGRIDPGEEPEQTIVRELKEELGIRVKKANLQPFGTYFVEAHDDSGKKVRMDAFWVKEWEGEPKPSSEIAELKWIRYKALDEMKLGNVFKRFIIPDLKKKDMIE